MSKRTSEITRTDLDFSAYIRIDFAAKDHDEAWMEAEAIVHDLREQYGDQAQVSDVQQTSLGEAS